MTRSETKEISFLIIQPLWACFMKFRILMMPTGASSANQSKKRFPNRIESWAVTEKQTVWSTTSPHERVSIFLYLWRSSLEGVEILICLSRVMARFVTLPSAVGPYVLAFTSTNFAEQSGMHTSCTQLGFSFSDQFVGYAVPWVVFMTR